MLLGNFGVPLRKNKAFIGINVKDRQDLHDLPMAYIYELNNLSTL